MNKQAGMLIFLAVRVITYATLFIGFFLVFLPARVLSWAGAGRPVGWSVARLAGTIITAGGAALVIWCILTFVVIGRGTPAPFDPPQRLVTAGPYGFVRNPMYLGAGLVLAGAALAYTSWALLAYLAVAALVIHLFVLTYEEPTLRRTFGDAYVNYCARVRRWLPMVERPGSAA